MNCVLAINYFIRLTYIYQVIFFNTERTHTHETAFQVFSFDLLHTDNHAVGKTAKPVVILRLKISACSLAPD